MSVRSGKKKKRSRWLLPVLAIVIAGGLFILFKVFGPNTGNFSQGEYLYIHTGSSYDNIKNALVAGGFVNDITSFDLLAEQANYPSHLHPGKYRIKHGMNNYNMVRMLRSGRQEPVKLVINKLRTKQDLINMICANLEADSVVLKQMLRDTVYLAQFGLDTNTAMCAIIPDTYEFFWNTSADKAFRKIEKNYARFWSDERKAKAAAKGITPTQATTIASIVDEETNMAADKPKIASVYLNRLRKGIRLQADPTVKFAIGDFTIRRVTGAHLAFQSPYNTYLNTGLPPGPICTPSQQSIDAVLNAPETNYIYFCAREDFSGYSRFAATEEEQAKNARLYHQALDARGIH